MPRFDGRRAELGQVAHWVRLSEATAYAQRVYADPECKVRYLGAAYEQRA